MLGPGLLLFFLVPGLLAYCAIYGLFHSGKSIAPEPPSVNSIEAVTVILLCSAIVHATTASLIDVNDMICATARCPMTVRPTILDPYARAFAAVEDKAVSGHALGGLLMFALAQGAIAYAAVRVWLGHLARRDRLPSWIYGWATNIANAADNDDALIVAYIMTTHEFTGRPIVYGGVLYDMALKPDGCISRITLWDCERYLARLDGGLDERTLPTPSSRFNFMLIESAHIRNVAFEIVDLTDAAIAGASASA